MTQNVGGLDRIIRIVLGLVLILAPLFGVFGGTTISAISIIIGIVLVATGTMQTCPLYKVLGVNTKKT